MSIVTDISKQQKTVALSILLTNLKSNLNEPSIQVSLFKFICYGKKSLRGMISQDQSLSEV